MNKFKDFMIWLIGTLVILILFRIGIRNNIGFLSFISVLAFVFLQIIAIVSLRQAKDAKRQKKYNEQNISNIEINDERFGRIIIKHDSVKHQYSGQIEKVKFDRQILTADLWCDDSLNLEKMIENLKNFCDKAVSMKRRIYLELANSLKDRDNYDENDNLIEITEQFLREKFRLSGISLGNEETVELEGSWEDSGSQDYSISYNIANDKFEYRLL